MSTLNFSIELKKRFTPSEWPWLLLSLRQDIGVWEALEKTDLGERALIALPAQAQAWSPAAISLIALDNPVTLEMLHATPLQPLEEGLTQRSSRVFEDWYRQPVNPAGLDTAGLLALVFREQYRASGAWQETLQNHAVCPDTVRTVFSCLYGMLPQPAGLMRALFRKHEMDWIGLAIHLLLSNPSPPEFQLAFLKDLIIDLEPASMMMTLQTLTFFRPHMAAALARQILANPSVSWTSGLEKSLKTEGIEQLEKLLQAFRTAQVHQIAGQADMAVPVLSDGLRMIRKVRGHLSAQLAHSVAQTRDVSVEGWGNTAREASIEAWKQAVQLSPDEPRYAAGYGAALLKAGREKEAAAYLKAFQDRSTHPDDPQLILTYALVLDKIGNSEKALCAILEALEMIEAGAPASEQEFIILASYLIKENEHEGALQAVQAGLRSFPASHDLLAMLAKIDFATCQPDGAINAVYAAQASKGCETALDTAGTQESVAGDETWKPSWLINPDQISIQKILVDSLETLGFWESAYDERLALLEGKAELTTQDLKELATSAAGAQKHEKVVEICLKLLQEEPSDLQAHKQLAEAAEALQDFDTAIEHFKWAVQLAPDQGVLWKGLYHAQCEAGRESAAFDTLRAASHALPDDPEIQLQLGELYLDQGAPTLALPCLKKAFESSGKEETSMNVATRLGETLCQLGRVDEARQVLEPLYNRMIDGLSTATVGSLESSKSPKYSNNLANIYARTMLSLGEPEKAVPILTQVVRYRPDDPRACLDLSKGLMMLSDRGSGARRAIPFLQRLMGIAPDGSIGGYAGRLANSPGLQAEARLLLAEAYATNCEWEKAMDAFRKALDEPANQTKEMQTRLSVGLGLTALKLELPEMAVAALREAAQSEPLNAHIQKNLSEAYISNNLSQDAFQAAEAALDLSPSDGETLGWFIDQGLKIAALPGASQQNIYSRVINALRAALAQSPERADLLIHLGSLLVRTGQMDEAIEVFRKLASLDAALRKVSLLELYQAAVDVLAAGDARLAVNLLRKAIDQLEGKESDAERYKDGVSLVDLYEVLIKAMEQLGDLDGALEAIDHALELDKAREALYAVKADVLFKLGRLDAARAALGTALQRWPNSPGLLYRMGRVLRAEGDLTGALHQAELGITALEDANNESYRRDLYLLAAKLANATLRPRRAFAYLQKAIPETDPDFKHLDNAMLRAEYALEAREEQAAIQAVAIIESQAASSPRLMADSGRLDYRLKDRTEGDKKCHSAVQLWIRLQMNQPGQKPATSKEEFMGELVSLGMAALESRMWKEGLSIFRQMVEMFPEEPLAHYMLAQALTICAEGQALCQDFEVVKNAPGNEALFESAWKEFEENIKTAAAQLGSENLLDNDETSGDVDVEIKRAIGIIYRRGKAVFIPSLEIAAALEYLLQMITPVTEDLVSLVMVFRRCGAKERAIKAVDTGWKPLFDGKDIRKEPEVIVQLALTDDNLEEAIEALRSILASPGIQGLIWPEPVMLQFLIAKLCYLMKDFPSAWEFIQKALFEWSDESRWQALAAAIHLAAPAENRAQQLSGATGYLERAVGLEPANSNHQLSLGQIYLESGQTKRAVQCLEQAAHLDPSKSETWLTLARAQNNLGDLESASISADRAIEKSINNSEALLLRGEIALKTNNFRGALSRAQAVLRLKPDQSKALVVMAKALEGLDRPVEALSALEKAMLVNENPIEMQLERLNLIKRSQGLDGGLKALQELVAQNPKQAAYLALLAAWLLQAGKHDAAVQAARLALQDGLEALSPQQKADLHTMIGLHMQKVGQLDQAIQHLSEATLESPEYVDSYLALGRVYQERREYQQALKTYQKAINFSGGDYRPYYQAGLVLKDNKDYMAAEAMLRRAAQLAPNEVSVHRMLGAVVALNLVHSRRLVSNEPRRD